MSRDTRPSNRRFLIPSRPQMVTLLLLSFISLVAHAEIYKWVDKSGVSHYSEQPPTAGIRYEEVNPLYAVPENSSAVPLKGEQQADQNEADLEKRQQQEQQQKAEIARVRQQNCVTMQKRLEEIQSASRIRIKKPDGSIERLTEEGRQTKIAEAQELVKKYCD